MDRKLSVLLALLIVGIFPALSINAWLSSPREYTEQQAIYVALGFLKGCPTFLFDGIEDSVDVVSVETLRMPWTWKMTISFQCRHAGYGDRTGMVLAQVITPHEIAVTVSEGEVVRAVIDGKWDELNQREVAQSELLPPEYAKDLVIEYILESYAELGAITLPEAWAFEILIPEGLVGASVQQFIGDGWTVNVSFPVVMKPVYTVSVEYSGDVSFTWEGTVDQSGKVEESWMSIKPKLLSAEDARDIVVTFLIESEETLMGLEPPSSWDVEVLTSPELVGYFSQRFTNGDWTVDVSNPVVWKPTYKVEAEYSGEFTFSWAGTVDQSGNIEESD